MTQSILFTRDHFICYIQSHSIEDRQWLILELAISCLKSNVCQILILKLFMHPILINQIEYTKLYMLKKTIVYLLKINHYCDIGQ